MRVAGLINWQGTPESEIAQQMTTVATSVCVFWFQSCLRASSGPPVTQVPRLPEFLSSFLQLLKYQIDRRNWKSSHQHRASRAGIDVFMVLVMRMPAEGSFNVVRTGRILYILFHRGRFRFIDWLIYEHPLPVRLICKCAHICVTHFGFPPQELRDNRGQNRRQ